MIFLTFHSSDRENIKGKDSEIGGNQKYPSMTLLLLENEKRIKTNNASRNLLGQYQK